MRELGLIPGWLLAKDIMTFAFWRTDSNGCRPEFDTFFAEKANVTFWASGRKQDEGDGMIAR